MIFGWKGMFILFGIWWGGGVVRGAHFTTSVAQAIGRDWNDPIWSPGPVSPTSGNSYEVLAGGLVRNPFLNSTSMFPGDSLQLNTGSILRMKPPADGVTTTLNFPGVGGAPGLILNGGGIDPGQGQTLFVVGGRMDVITDSFVLGPTGDSGRNVRIAAAISGSGSITVKNFPAYSGVTVQSSSNSYSGNWILSLGRLTGISQGSLGSGNITVATGSKVEILYGIITPGILTLETANAVAFFTGDCQFSGMSVNGELVAAGVYSYTELQQRFPSNFLATGSGSVKIVPSESRLTVSRSGSGNAVTLTFSTGLAHYYTLQSESGIEENSWSAVGNRIAGDGKEHSVEVAVEGMKFFRVLVE
jgi:hypothetical protein